MLSFLKNYYIVVLNVVYLLRLPRVDQLIATSFMASINHVQVSSVGLVGCLVTVHQRFM